MRHSFKSLLAVAVALTMALSLAACSNDGGENGEEKLPAPAEDPYGYITAASEKTAEDVAQRYSGSPLAAIAGLIQSTGELDLTVSVEEGPSSVDVLGSITYDTGAPAVRVDASVGLSDAVEITGSAYLSRDFMGVSVPLILGDDTFYGIVPHDLYDQVSGSVLAQGMTDEDLEAFRQLDEMLKALSGAAIPDTEALTQQYTQLARDIAAAVKYEVEQYSGQLNGQDDDGWHIFGVMDSDGLADAADRLGSFFLDDSIWGAMESLYSYSGVDLDLSSARDELKAAVDEVRASGVSCKYDYYILDGRVARMVLTVIAADGQETPITVDYYDGGALTVSFSLNGQDFRISSEISDGPDYEHKLTIANGSESIDMVTTWDAGGELNLTISADGETYVVRGKLTVTDQGFTLDDITFESEGETLNMPLTLTYTPGVAPDAPAATANFFELSEEDYEYLFSLLDLG